MVEWPVGSCLSGGTGLASSSTFWYISVAGVFYFLTNCTRSSYKSHTNWLHICEAICLGLIPYLQLMALTHNNKALHYSTLLLPHCAHTRHMSPWFLIGWRVRGRGAHSACNAHNESLYPLARHDVAVILLQIIYFYIGFFQPLSCIIFTLLIKKPWCIHVLVLFDEALLFFFVGVGIGGSLPATASYASEASSGLSLSAHKEKNRSEKKASQRCCSTPG